jgi:exosortase/archaeosortase family protein
MRGDRAYLIAPACAGFNFLIAAFLLLTFSRIFRLRSKEPAWSYIPVAALVALVSTIVANTFRIVVAMKMGDLPAPELFDSRQSHRWEGIFVYFGFLLLLFFLSERLQSERNRGLFRQSLLLPLTAYYLVALGIPLINGGYKQGSVFWEHSISVFLIPLLLIMPFAVLRFYRH